MIAHEALSDVDGPCRLPAGAAAPHQAVPCHPQREYQHEINSLPATYHVSYHHSHRYLFNKHASILTGGQHASLSLSLPICSKASFAAICSACFLLMSGSDSTHNRPESPIQLQILTHDPGPILYCHIARQRIETLLTELLQPGFIIIRIAGSRSCSARVANDSSSNTRKVKARLASSPPSR